VIWPEELLRGGGEVAVYLRKCLTHYYMPGFPLYTWEVRGGQNFFSVSHVSWWSLKLLERIPGAVADLKRKEKEEGS